MSSKALVIGDGIYHVIAGLWHDHRDDGAGGELRRVAHALNPKGDRRELRWAVVEAALQAVKSDPLMKRRFNELQKRMHRNQAIVSIAHHLLELIWYVLTRHQPYRGFTQERIAYKYLSWSWHVKEEARHGLTHQQFARYYLMKIGLGKELTRIALDPKHPYRLASEAEVLALCPELRQIE